MEKKRLQILSLGFVLLFSIITVRLFYWQVLSKPRLLKLAQAQREALVRLPANRGEIFAADGYPLVGNQPAYVLFAYTPDLDQDPMSIADKLAPLIADTPEMRNATPSAEYQLQLQQEMHSHILSSLTTSDSSWIPLKKDVSRSQKQAVESMEINGIGFDEYQVRLYPESSMSAQLVGFVGSDGTGKPKGYFGLEGYYDTELTGKSGIIRQEKDALGKPIIIGEFSDIKTRDGRTLHTHIDRSIQMLAETALKQGMEKYGASKGEIIIMHPSTGAIIALASYPNYEPEKYKLFQNELYKLPSIADTFEPGSIFKPLVMAAAVNEGVLTPETTCDTTCNGPVKIGQYYIRTWNNQYHPGSTMTEVLENSDNTGMVYVANKLGNETLRDYLKDFGFGQSTGIDLESEVPTRIKASWGDIDRATASFGQGIAVTSMQMIAAINAIANKGVLMQPQVVSTVQTSHESIPIRPKPVRQVISPETANTMKQMMIASAEHGDAKWAIPDGYLIAGKTGTAQVAIQGQYDASKTIASFVGFAPANDPQFTMLVKLSETKTSPWASETAAPLWFQLAKDLFIHLNIKPQQDSSTH